jgi:hypothetical protein
MNLQNVKKNKIAVIKICGLLPVLLPALRQNDLVTRESKYVLRYWHVPNTYSL